MDAKTAAPPAASLKEPARISGQALWRVRCMARDRNAAGT
jgi:hypothetical protein